MNINGRVKTLKGICCRSFAEYHNIGFMETSAKTGFNVDDAFAYLTQEIYDRIKVDG